MDIPKLLQQFLYNTLESEHSRKLGIRREVAVWVNQESMNKSSSNKVFLRLLHFKDVFRIKSNTYNGAFFAKILYNFKLLTISAKRVPS